MGLNQPGWVGKKLQSPGADVSGLPSKKGKGKKNTVKMEGGKMLLGSEMKNNTKNPGALKQ